MQALRSSVARFVDASKMEEIHLRNTPLPVMAIPGSPASFFPHRYSDELLQRYCGKSILQPVSVRSDGNCFFNSLSVALYSSEESAAHIRLRCAIHYGCNLQRLESDDDLISKYAPPLVQDLRLLTTNGGYSSVRAFKAAAEVCGVTVESVYLPIRGVSDVAARSLTCAFKSSSTTASCIVYIMWTRCNTVAEGEWFPNHFVPLLSKGLDGQAVEVVSDDDIVIQPTTSSVKFATESHVLPKTVFDSSTDTDLVQKDMSTSSNCQLDVESSFTGVQAQAHSTPLASVDHERATDPSDVANATYTIADTSIPNADIRGDINAETQGALGIPITSFATPDNILKLLTSTETTVEKCVPRGKKENVAILKCLSVMHVFFVCFYK